MNFKKNKDKELYLDDFLSDYYKKREFVKNLNSVKKLMMTKNTLIIITDPILPDYNKTFYFSHYTPTTGFWSYKKEKEDFICKGYVGWNQFEII